MKDETDTKASDEVMTEGRLVYAVSAIIRKASDRALASWDLTVAQAPFLVVLREAGCPITIGDLARLLMLESPSVTTMIDRLSEHGLVERTGDPKDRRRTLVQLTEEGKRLQNSIREPGQQLYDEIFDVVTDEERQVLRAILRKFRDENIAWLE